MPIVDHWKLKTNKERIRKEIYNKLIDGLKSGMEESSSVVNDSITPAVPHFTTSFHLYLVLHHYNYYMRSYLYWFCLAWYHITCQIRACQYGAVMKTYRGKKNWKYQVKVELQG